jgi:hypothetical protein
MRTVLVALAALLVLAAPAAAKEGVRAHLETHVPREARAGTTLTVTWSLYSVENGVRRPFGAGGLFVRLRGGSGGLSKAYGHGSGGRYTARVKVPRGGIARIRFGLEGVRIVAGHESPAPHYFPLDNDPFAMRN